MIDEKKKGVAERGVVHRKKASMFLFNAEEWLASKKIALMSLEQEGAYIRLLSYMWSDPHCSLPMDDGILGRLSRLGERWGGHENGILRGCFVPHPEASGMITNMRLYREKKRQDEFFEKLSLSGKRGASKRWGGHDLAIPYAYAYSSSLNTNTNTDTEGKEKVADKNPEIKLFIDYAFNCFQKKFGEKLLIDGKKDGEIVRKLLGTYGLLKLKGLWDVFMRSTDPFIRQAGYSIGVFKSQINKLLVGGKAHGGRTVVGGVTSPEDYDSIKH